MDTHKNTVAVNGLSLKSQFMKRAFDLIVSSLLLATTWWLIIILYILASLDTKQSGFFTQTRIGKHGKPFKVIKLRSMRNLPQIKTTVTTSYDPRITTLGRIWRKTKLDELPQLINVFLGQMSFVGPRPDVPGYADKLTGNDRIILSIPPGITGPATLHYRNEEELLAQQDNPEHYNQTVIYPHKVQLNREYIENYSFAKDLRYIWQTVAG